MDGFDAIERCEIYSGNVIRPEFPSQHSGGHTMNCGEVNGKVITSTFANDGQTLKKIYDNI